jgi:hypothetical protein
MTPRWLVEKNERIERARGPFETLCLGRLHVDNGDLWRGGRLRVYEKLTKALSALREWRYANNQKQHTEDETALAIRVVCDAMATEISEAAGDGQDPATVAWVVAGLRCPSRPFCRGCDSCFTVDAPHRHDAAFGAAAGIISG